MLIPIWIRLSVFMPTQNRIRIQDLHMLQYQNSFFTFIHSGASLHCFYLSRQRHRCHNFQYFGHNWNLLEIAKQSFTFGWQGSGFAKMMPIRRDPDPQHWIFCFVALKVVGSDKGGGSGGWLLFEDGFRPWRSMSVYFLMMPSSFCRSISVSCL